MKKEHEQYKAHYQHIVKTNTYDNLLNELHRLIDLRAGSDKNLNRHDIGLMEFLMTWYEERH